MYDSVMDFEQVVGRFLLANGYVQKVSGYYYAKDSIIYILENRGFDCNKVLFDLLAKKHNTAPTNIERCIRTFINKVYPELKASGLFAQKPSGREFILKCVEYIALDLRPRTAYDILSL